MTQNFVLPTYFRKYLEHILYFYLTKAVRHFKDVTPLNSTPMQKNILFLATLCFSIPSLSQKEPVKFVQEAQQNKIDIYVGKKWFTSFIYPDSLEKPVLYPVHAANGTMVTRGFPLNPKPGEPTDHPHHTGIWFNYENVNGLDFWNNSFAIPADKKKGYGWITVTSVSTDAAKGTLTYKANWTNQQKEILLEENTTLYFGGEHNRRLLDRITTLTAKQPVAFNDAKDGLYGMRLAHELQIPNPADQKFTDDKGNVTIVKGGTDHIPNGNYLTSEGKTGNDAWSTRGAWCMVYGKMGNDTISIAMIDHPSNPNYPTFWHARGYGLFAANPLGEKVFTEGKKEKNLNLAPGESVTFRYRILIADQKHALKKAELDGEARNFAGK